MNEYIIWGYGPCRELRQFDTVVPVSRGGGERDRDEAHLRLVPEAYRNPSNDYWVVVVFGNEAKVDRITRSAPAVAGWCAAPGTD